MKVRLMYTDRPFDPTAAAPARTTDLTADLGLETLVAAMADGDRFFADIARSATIQLLTDPGQIRYRQQILQDCVARPAEVRHMYDIATEAMDVERNLLLGFGSDRPRRRVHNARLCLSGYSRLLRELRAVVDETAPAFSSPGLFNLCRSVQEELSDDYLVEVDRNLQLLEFHTGLLETARLGRANEAIDHVLRTPTKIRHSIADLLTSEWPRHTVTVPERDIAGLDALVEMQEHGLAVTAEALSQSAAHVKGYLLSLRQELAFYLGCLNLRDLLLGADLPVCFPDALSIEHGGLSATGLYDPMLAVRGERHTIVSDVAAGDSDLLVITGANQGGKSTFLRALGIAQLMMQCGMFVAACTFTSSVAGSIHTHFKRGEDQTMRSGKLDEELARMSTIVDSVSRGDLLLCNESFSSTNEREAATIGGTS